MNFFKVKIDKKWVMVQAEGMVAINAYCKDQGYADWKMVGMMSRGEMLKAKKLCKVVGQ